MSSKVQKFLSSPEGSRFTKLVGMLGSDGDGERSNAAGMATALLKKHDLTWAEVMGGAEMGSFTVHVRHNASGRELRDLKHRLAILERSNGVLAADLRGAQENGRKQAHELRRLNAKLRDTQEALDAAVRLGSDPEILQRLEAENRELKGKLASSANPEFRGEKPRLRPGGGFKALGPTPFQEQLNLLISEIESHIIELNNREEQFLTSLRDVKWKLSEKQWRWLDKIADQANVDIRDFIDEEFLPAT